LRDREGERVHHADEGDDAAGLAVEPDGFADAAHAAPIGADAAAAAGEPDILVPRLDNAFEAVGDRVQIAADRQAAAGAAVRQHGGGGHEPQFRNIVVQALRMLLIVGIGRRDAGEEILIGFAGKQVTILERFLAEVGEQRVAAPVGHNLESARVDLRLAAVVELGRFACHGRLILRQFHRRHVACLHPFCLAKIHLTRPRSQRAQGALCSCLVRLRAKPRS